MFYALHNTAHTHVHMYTYRVRNVIHRQHSSRIHTHTLTHSQWQTHLHTYIRTHTDTDTYVAVTRATTFIGFLSICVLYTYKSFFLIFLFKFAKWPFYVCSLFIFPCQVWLLLLFKLITNLQWMPRLSSVPFLYIYTYTHAHSRTKPTHTKWSPSQRQIAQLN